jgi:glycosyltransferase involved in cell wall biosynthesis
MRRSINLFCPVGKTGYGITSLNILKALNDLDIDVSLFSMGSKMELNNETEKALISSCLERAHTFNNTAPCLKIWHQDDLALRVGSGHFYSFPFFELDTLTPKAVHHLNSCMGVFTASNWSKDVLKNNGVTVPVTVSPLAVDTEIFKTPPKIRISNNNYVFFHIGKWEKRKSQDFLLKAFEQAFDANDNVELWLMPHNMFLNKEEEQVWLNLVENNKLKDKIRIFARVPTQYDLAEFIFYGDCGVFLSRAEGWNNEILECMALNKPIIATNYSAHTEYLTKDNSFLVDVKHKEVAHDDKWFFGEGSWAKLDDDCLSQTIDYMRMVYADNVTNNPNGLVTAKKYTWNNTANIINQTITRNNSYHFFQNRQKKRR